MVQEKTRQSNKKPGCNAANRREILSSGAALGASALVPAVAWSQSRTDNGYGGQVVPMRRGPYQNNGAAPWYGTLAMGSQAQALKFGLDTGSNFAWIASELCLEPGPDTKCPHYGGGYFNQTQSSSFRWYDRMPEAVSFGPWGTMNVELGGDRLSFNDDASAFGPLYLAESFEQKGNNFAELNWDGGIGFPSSTSYADPKVAFFLSDLMQSGQVGWDYPYVSFDWDKVSQSGSCTLGGIDPDKFDPHIGIFLPFQAYTGLGGGAKYLWTSPLFDWQVGAQSLPVQDFKFCLDSGSSRFKGDLSLMQSTLDMTSNPGLRPDVTLTLGQQVGTYSSPGTMVLSPDIYMQKIEAGDDEGRILPQFGTSLNIPQLALVGSVIMDHCYTIFEYDVTVILPTPPHLVLQPVGMWLFAKPDIPSLIRNRSDRPAEVGRRKRPFFKR